MKKINVLKVENNGIADNYKLHYTEEESIEKKVVALPLRVGDRYIHFYNNLDISSSLFAVGLSQDEVFIDEEECGNIPLKKYQEILKSFGAKMYHHKFIYSENDVKDVEDSYFENINDAIKCAEYLESL